MKKLHPIRDLRIELELACSTAGKEHTIARLVKPLLDALELEHEGNVLGAGALMCGCSLIHDEPPCPTCRLLAEWRRPL